MQLQVIEQGLITVYSTDNGDKLVVARELHEGIESKRDFSTWIKKRITDCDLIENQDFIRLTQKVEANNATKIEYYLKLDTAKEVAMMERNEKGKQYRRYLIHVENKYKQLVYNTQNLSPELRLLINMEMEQKKMKEEVESVKKEASQVKAEIQDMKDTIILNPKASWRCETNRIISNICKGLNDYKSPKDQIYKALEERAKCKLDLRLNNLKARALSNGMAPSKVKKLNFLDVIGNDVRLKEIYIAIVKEFGIKNRV